MSSETSPLEETVNIIDYLKNNRQELLRCKELFAKDSWDQVKSDVEDVLLSGLPVLYAFYSAPGQASRLRYDEWNNSASIRFIQCLNQLPESTQVFGGPLLASEEVLRPIGLCLDRFLVDLLLVAAKLKRTILPLCAEHSECERLTETLRTTNISIAEEWQKRFRDQLLRHLDEIGCMLFNQPFCDVEHWVVVCKILRTETVEQRHFAGELRSGVAVYNHDDVDGHITDVHYLSGTDPVVLWTSIMSAHDIKCDSSLLPAPQRFVEFFSPKAEICHFTLAAHPNAIQNAVAECMAMASGLVTLFRTLDSEDWRREVAQMTVGTTQHRVFENEPSVGVGFAMRLGGHPFQSGPSEFTRPMELSEQEPIPLSIPSLLVPLSSIELKHLEETFSKPAFHFLNFLLGVTGGPGVNSRIKRAFHFWARAEVRRVGMDLIAASPWSLAEVFLDYCMAVEILLGEASEVVQIVSSRAAALLADNPDDRLELFERVKGLYGKRSKYVHEGTLMIRYEDVHTLREIARQCLLYCLQYSGGALVVRFYTGEGKFNDKLSNLGEKVRSEGVTTSDAKALDETMRSFMELGNRFSKHCDYLRLGARRMDFSADD